MKVQVAGENALIIYFGQQASPGISAQVQQAAARLTRLLADDLIDLIPSYASLLVIFDPDSTDHFRVRRVIQAALNELDAALPEAGRLVELPVYYHSEVGPDLDSLANDAGLSTNEVIERHQAQEYRVYAIGFAPGFAYLGEVDQSIARPRLSTPRLKVPRGSVAIADRQTAVYPATSPGGWNLIGRCPTPMFDPQADPIMPVSVGDRVRFQAITRERFLELGGVLEPSA